MSTPRSEKIQALRTRLAALQAAEQAATARAKAAASKANRAQDTRRKVLAGAFVLESLGLDGFTKLSIRGRSFDQWLTRPDDRTLFQLPPLAGPPGTPAPPGPGVPAAGSAAHAGGASA